MKSEKKAATMTTEYAEHVQMYIFRPIKIHKKKQQKTILTL